MSQVRVVSVHSGGAKFCAETRGHQLFCDVPPAMGGTDTAMTPVEAMLAGLGNCLGTVIALFCQNKGLPYEGLKVEVTAELLEEEHQLDNFVVKVHMPEVNEAVKRTVEAAHGFCNVGNTIEKGAKVTVEVVE